MAKSAVTLDTVMINIESNAGKATSNIDSLATSLEKLKNSIKGGFNNINKLATSLEKLKKASKGLKSATTNLSNLAELVEPLKALNEVSNPKGLAKTIETLNKLPAALKKIDAKALKNMTRVSNELSTALSPLANKLAIIGNGFSAINQLSDKYGVSVTKVKDKTNESSDVFRKISSAMSLLPGSFNKLTRSSENFSKRATRGLKSVHSSVKQIALSLLGTRTLFTAIRKAISEYMQLDQQLTKTTQNLWRALGAQLAPAVEYIIKLFTHLVRVVYSIVYALTGVDLIARANAKAMASWGKAAKDTLGSLQKFDDLNVVEFNKDTGEDNLINLDKIDLTPIQKVIDWMKKLKEAIQTAWKTGEWAGISKVLAEGINGAFEWINPVLIADKISTGVITALDVLATLLDEIDWGLIGTKIREIIVNIDWKTIWDGVVEVAKEAFRGLQDFIGGLFGIESEEWSGLLATIVAIGAAFSAFKILEGFNGLSAALNAIGIAMPTISLSFSGLLIVLGSIALIAAGLYLIIDGIIKFIESPTWEAFAQILAGIALVLGAIALIIGSVPVIIAAIIVAVIALIIHCWDEIVAFFKDLGKIIADAWNSFTNWLGSIWDAVVTFFTDLWADIKQWFSDLGNSVKEKVIDPIVNGFKSMGEKLASIWNTIKTAWNNFWGGLWDGAKKVINGVLGGVEGFINGIISGLNWLIKKINTISFDVPDWVPLIGGKKLGFNIKQISTVSLPRLETGTNEVPYDDMLAVLHKGEAVVPKKYNPAVGGGNSQEMLDRFDKLIFLMENQEQTTIVNVGNKKLYQEQKKYDKRQYNKYGTLSA